MKIRIREGNDFDVAWAIKRAGVPEDLSTAINMKLTLVVYGLVIEHNLFTVTDNVLSINIPKEVATVNGDYRLIFEYTLPDAGQPDGDLKCKTDVVPFRIVPFTAKADDIYTINVTSDIAFGFKGDKGDDGDDAYQIWLDLGNEGTYEDFIAYLRQPAIDAGASISELEGEIQVSEGLRVQAESERDLAETARIQAESERLASEIIRQSNEGGRIEDEVIRVQNESERISEEGIRQNNEIDRVEAEGIRQSNEINRIEAEGLREQAEVERQITIQEAVTATNLANEKANLANVAAQSANEAAGLADTARTELTTAVNAKLGEADDKIEEMDTTLSTYDGRVTQVESDITQLAGDVNVKMENELINGSFELDFSNWNKSGGEWNISSNAKHGSKSCNLIAGGSPTYGFSSDINCAVGDKIYAKCSVLRNSGSGARIDLYNRGSFVDVVGILMLPAQYDMLDIGVWTDFSGVGTTASDGYRMFFGRYNSVSFDFLIDSLMSVNITKTFGKGDEPTKEEMDMLIDILGVGYFDGEITVTQKQIMNWQLKMIRQNRNAIVALGGTII